MSVPQRCVSSACPHPAGVGGAAPADLGAYVIKVEPRAPATIPPGALPLYSGRRQPSGLCLFHGTNRGSVESSSDFESPKPARSSRSSGPLRRAAGELKSAPQEVRLDYASLAPENPI